MDIAIALVFARIMHSRLGVILAGDTLGLANVKRAAAGVVNPWSSNSCANFVSQLYLSLGSCITKLVKVKA